MKKGDKIICVNAKGLLPNSHVVEGEIYTIKKVVKDCDGLTSFLLWETVNGSKYGHPGFYGYADYRFRKVVKNNAVLPHISNRLFRIFYTVFLTTIYFGLQLLMMKFNIWVMISINTVLMAIAADSTAKHYRKWKNDY